MQTCKFDADLSSCKFNKLKFDDDDDDYSVALEQDAVFLKPF